MDFRLTNESVHSQHQQQLRRQLGTVALPSPLEGIATGGHGSSVKPSVSRNTKAAFKAASGLSARTVTTTTVTTTTVTTYPPLKLPRVRKNKALTAEMYPLASTRAPAALERFAIDINGQNLYFSQNSFDGSSQSGEDILASITANTNEDRGTVLDSVVDHGYGHDEQLQRAMTPLYTQDDQQPSVESLSGAYLDSFECSSARRDARLSRGSGDRRSSSPQTPEPAHGHFGRSACSPSPRIRRTQTASSDADADNIGDDGEGSGSESGDGVHALPLPSPLLSPRAQPEAMDTDEAESSELAGGVLAHGSAQRQLQFKAEPGMTPPETGQPSGAFGRTHTRTERAVTQQEVCREMAAVYDMPDIMMTYDNLPPAMQTYLLFQLLRRTTRPGLQFAAQTVAPVLQRDFVGELPPEVSHHVLKFMGTRELCRAACVSRAWQRVVDGDRAVWRARLIDARYVEEPTRVHPLCHLHFGLGSEEPPRSVAAARPTADELDLGHLAVRPNAPQERIAHTAQQLLLPPENTGVNPFKESFARSYRLDRNWQSGKCRQFSFACDGGAVVTCVQLTDKYIIAGFDTKNIYVFDISTGAVVRRLEGHDGGVWALAVVGSTVVSGSTDRTVRVWDLETGRCTHVFTGHSSTVRCLQVLLPTDVRTPAERARNAPVRYEPREPMVVTGSRDTTLRVWRLPSPTRDASYSPRSSNSTSAAASRAPAIPTTPVPPREAQADDERMAVDQGSGASESNVHSGRFGQRLAELERRRHHHQHQHQHQHQADEKSIRNASRPNPYFERALIGHTDSVRAVAGHGNIVASGSYDGTVRVWDVTTGECIHQLEGHMSKVYTIVLDPDHHAIFSGSMDGMIRVWNWDTGACLRILRGHLTLVGLLALRHGALVSAGADTTLRVWDHPLRTTTTEVEQQRPFSNIPGDTVPYTPQPAAAVNVITNHALAAIVHHAAGNIQQLHLLQQLQLQQRANDQLHQQLAGSSQEPADIVRTERFMLRQHTNAITCFQHDGTKIVSGADTTLKLWDVRTGRFVRDLLSNMTSVWQVRFDARRCVAAVNRNDVTCFEVMDFGASL
ncbi:SCF ubiquitin ligase complex subunit cdc4 [Coemansia sp. RSA 1821]|nr:SCF ubiquitin ligase complex subunit cdc4 [Coemansia sp. RSA 1821]